MIALETLTGTGMAIFYPASQALLPRLVPGDLLQQASAISRLAMNAGQMGGAIVAGLCVAAFGPGWALAVCGVGSLVTVPLLLSIRARGRRGPRTPACSATCGRLVGVPLAHLAVGRSSRSSASS